MRSVNRFVLPLVGVGVLALAAWPVYAHCGKCAGDCKNMVKAMETGKTSLSAAITAAEEKSKGKAVGAYPTMKDDKLTVDVYCMVGDKLMQVAVDSTGKAGDAKEAKSLPGMAEAKPKPSPGG